MNAKEYLQQYLEAESICNSKLDQLTRLHEMATQVTAPIGSERVQTTTENKIERIVVQIIECEDELSESIERLKQTGKEVEKAIACLSDIRHRKVLRYIYIDDKKIEEVAYLMNYDYYHVCHLHGFALAEIQKFASNRKTTCDKV